MRERFSDLMIMVTIAAASGIPMSITRTAAQAQAVSATALKTPWGEPDLQGIWTDEFDTPLQRPPKYGNQEVFSEAQREELDKERSALYGQERPADRGTEFDVARAYNHAVFLSNKHVGARTSLIIDPPNGRIPQLTPEARKIAAGDREFRLALLQSTQTCKNKLALCSGGRYDPTPSPRRADLPPRYNTVRMNRYDGPEDGGLGERCLTGPSLEPHSAGASAGSCRPPAALRCSMTWVRGKGGSGISS
jgi:hypothetical protein